MFTVIVIMLPIVLVTALADVIYDLIQRVKDHFTFLKVCMDSERRERVYR